MSVRVLFIVGLCMVAGMALGCTWVPLTAAGEQVQLANAKFVENCKPIGKTRAKTKPTVMGFGRSASTLRGELASLARNDAGVMGGTHVSPIGDLENGEQTYGIYVCSGGTGG